MDECDGFNTVNVPHVQRSADHAGRQGDGGYDSSVSRILSPTRLDGPCRRGAHTAATASASQESVLVRGRWRGWASDAGHGGDRFDGSSGDGRRWGCGQG